MTTVKTFTAPTAGTYSFSNGIKNIQIYLEKGQIVDVDELFKNEQQNKEQCFPKMEDK